MTTIPCKVYMNQEIQPYLNCWVSSNLPLNDLRRIVERATPKFRLGSIRYVDDEGDKITIETDIELAEALKLGQKLGSLQLFVEPGTPQTTEAISPKVAPAVAPEIKVPEKVEPQPVAPTPAPAPAPPTAAAPPTHRAICDACNKYIVGIRYKCVNCPDYDLCEVCEERNGSIGSVHQADHVFLKIRRPICPHQRINLPNLYERRQSGHGVCTMVRQPGHGVFRGRCGQPAAAPAPAPQSNITEDRFAALEAKVAQLTQDMQQVSAKAQKELADKKQLEERKKAQEEKRKEVRALLQKAGEERKAIKKEQKMKKEQQREAARQAVLAKKEAQAARQAARQAAAATPATTAVVVEEVKKEEEVVAAPEVVVKVEEVAHEPAVVVEETENKGEEVVVVKIEDAEEVNEEEEKKEDDFVVINDEVPPTHDERTSFFKESLEILASMGFNNLERNLQLLARHSGDIQAVITALLDLAEVV